MSQGRIKLRPYQKDALGSVLEAAERAQRVFAGAAAGAKADRCLAIQPTGSGKTVLFLASASAVFERWRWKTLIIVPSRELCSQTASRAAQFIPGAQVGQIVPGRPVHDLGDIVIGTAQSLHGRRLETVPSNAFDLIVIDEAHHAAAESFGRILRHFQGARLVIGVTATYRRGDGVSVAGEEWFPTVIVYNTIAQLTDWGYLVPCTGRYIYSELSLEEVAVRSGNFDEKQLARTVNVPERNALAVEGWLRHARGRPTVAFCVDVGHAQDLAEAFCEQGVRSRAVWGAMPKEEYAEVMRDYRARKIDVLTNARLLIEGWDSPFTECCLITRPATPASSRVLGPQMIGRVLRPSPETGKRDAIILEIRDLGDRRAGEGPRELFVPGAGEAVSLIADALEISEADVASGQPLHQMSWLERERRAWLERQRLLESLKNDDLEEVFDVIERVTAASTYAWVPLGATLYMDLGGGDFCEVVEDGPGYFEVRAAVGGALSCVGTARTRSRALGIADGWLDRHGVDQYLHKRAQGWRSKQPTSVQIGVAHGLTGRPREELSALTRGQISDLITSVKALKHSPRIERVAVAAGAGPRGKPGAAGQLALWH